MTVLVQTLVAALIVSGCTVYSAWALLPAAARRRVASALLKLPLPQAVAGFMRGQASGASSLGCGGCHRNRTSAPRDRLPEQAALLVFHPPRKR